MLYDSCYHFLHCVHSHVYSSYYHDFYSVSSQLCYNYNYRYYYDYSIGYAAGAAGAVGVTSFMPRTEQSGPLTGLARLCGSGVSNSFRPLSTSKVLLHLSILYPERTFVTGS
jgi:hypothetical protein